MICTAIDDLGVGGSALHPPGHGRRLSRRPPTPSYINSGVDELEERIMRADRFNRDGGELDPIDRLIAEARFDAGHEEVSEATFLAFKKAVLNDDD